MGCKGVFISWRCFPDVISIPPLGGSIGEVSVTWSVDGARSSAVYGTDYSADGATLTFAPGDTRRCKSVCFEFGNGHEN